MTKTVTVIPGDGIGPEVTQEALQTIESLGLDLTVDVLDHVNADTYLRTGVSLSDEDFERIKASDSVLFGAIGDPRVKTSTTAAASCCACASTSTSSSTTAPPRCCRSG